MDSDTARDPDGVTDGHADEESVHHYLNCFLHPGAPVPATVLVADMGVRATLLQGWRDRRSACPGAVDAVQLRHTLAAAFGNGQL